MSGKANCFCHVGIVTNDIERLKNFYIDILGLTFIRQYRCDDEASRETLGMEGMEQDIAVLTCGEEGPYIEIISYVNPKESSKALPKDFVINDIGITHLSIYVDDIEDIYLCIKELNLECISSPVWHDNGSAYMFFRDPDGNWCELIQKNR